MDHHCPWINNCVGERNQKYFLQFLFYVGVLAVYSVILVVVSWYMEGLDGLEGKMKGGGGGGEGTDAIRMSREAMFAKQARILHSVILILESILFGLFVVAIGCDQVRPITQFVLFLISIKLRTSMTLINCQP